MKEDFVSHACRELTPGGSYRAIIGFTKMDEVCRSCGVKITEQFAFKPQGIDSTASPSKAAAVQGPGLIPGT